MIQLFCCTFQILSRFSLDHIHHTNDILSGPLVWLDPTLNKSADGNQSQPVKLIGVVSYGDPPPCGLAGAYASITSVVEWIKDVTSDCNKLTCGKGECMTKDKLMASLFIQLS